MPVGLDTAAFLVTKFCHPLLIKWRGNKILSYMHIDDSFCFVIGEKEAFEAVKIVKDDLHKVGFTDQILRCLLNICIERFIIETKLTGGDLLEANLDFISQPVNLTLCHGWRSH